MIVSSGSFLVMSSDKECVLKVVGAEKSFQS